VEPASRPPDTGNTPQPQAMQQLSIKIFVEWLCVQVQSSHATLSGCGVAAGYTWKGHDDNDVELHVLQCWLTY